MPSSPSRRTATAAAASATPSSPLSPPSRKSQLRQAQQSASASSAAANQVDQDHQRRLEEASTVCARGRQYWTSDGDAQKAVAEFEHALQLLETLLGTYHALTAKTYYWLGFIRKHNPATYQEALRAFCATARIRLVLLGPSHESTQEAISAIRWVLQHQQKAKNNNSKQSSEFVKQYLSNLYESIRLETLGDARLRHRDYSQAIEYYKRAMASFHDPTHATIMGKRAFCCFKRNELDQAMYWYRQAILIFTTQTVHRESHPDVPTTLERMQQVLQSYTGRGEDGSTATATATATATYSAETIEHYCSTILTSVEEQYLGQTALDHGNVSKARDHFETSLEIEASILGNDHGIIQDTLQPLVDLTRRLSNDTQLEQTMAKLQDEKNLLEQKLEAIQSVVVEDPPGDVSREEDEEVEVDSQPTMAGSPDATSSTTQFQAQFKALQLEKDDTTIENVRLEERVKNLEQERKELQVKSERAQLSFEEVHSRLDEQQVSLEAGYQARWMQQEKDLEEERALRAKAEESLTHAQSQLSAFAETQERDVQAHTTTIQQLEKQLSDRESQMRELRTKMKAYQSKLQSSTELRSVSKTPTSTGFDELANELEQYKKMTNELQARLELAETDMESLREKNHFSEHKLEEAMGKQQSLSKELQQKLCDIEELQEQIIKLEMGQSALQEQLSRAPTNEYILETPVGSPARSKINAASPGGASTMSSVQIDMDPRSTELKARRLEAQLQDLSHDLNSAETDDAIARNKLQSQNEQAVVAIKALSKELIGMEEKYRKLGAKHEKLRLLFSRLEQKNRTLKEQNIQIIRAANQGSASTAGVVNTTSSSTRSLTVGAKERPLPTEGLLKSVLLSKSSYKSPLAEYILRRPFLRDDETTDEERRCFSNMPVCASPDLYGNRAHVEDPSSIELMASITFDNSRLYLVGTPAGDTKIAQRRIDGTWSDLGTLDSSQSEPLGWVAFPSTTKGDADKYYSLDEMVEEALIYRQHYCQSVSLNASFGKGHNFEAKLLGWLAARTKSPYLESVAYSYGSKSFQKQARLFERPGVMLLLLAVLVALLSVAVARYLAG